MFWPHTALSSSPTSLCDNRYMAMAASSRASSGHFSILYFAAASTFTGKPNEQLPAPVRARELFHVLEQKYPGITQMVLSSCAVTVNMEYVDIDEDDGEHVDRVIVPGDEVAIIPPVSSG